MKNGMIISLLFISILLISGISGCSSENKVKQMSGSMEPTIQKGEVVKTEKVDFSEIKVRDIVVLATDNIPVITRVISINKENKTFIGKADANGASGLWEKDVSLEKIISRVIGK